ncbi:MAG: hypothetical protein ABW133_08355, partial [Polyangiaceae bacterium]
MRVADTTRFRNIQDQVARAQASHADAARQAASGLRVGAPSDDPVAAAQALRVSHSINRTEGYRSTINSLKGDVELAESSRAGPGRHKPPPPHPPPRAPAGHRPQQGQTH